MLWSSTIFLPSERTPPAAEGVLLGPPEVVDVEHEGQRAPRLWIHGVLSVPASEVTAGTEHTLPRGTFFAAVTEAGQLSGTASLAGDREILSSPVVAAQRDRGPVFELAFSIDVSASAGVLLRDACHVHASHGRYTSAVLRVVAPQSPIDAPAPAPTPMDALLRAHGLARAGWFVPAAESFAAALADPRIAADLDGAHLYNAACAASLAASASEGAKRRAFEEQGLGYLRDERARMTPLAEEAAKGPREGRGARRLARRRAALARRAELVASAEPDLAHLRTLAGWSQIAAACR